MVSSGTIWYKYLFSIESVSLVIVYSVSVLWSWEAIQDLWSKLWKWKHYIICIFWQFTKILSANYWRSQIYIVIWFYKRFYDVEIIHTFSMKFRNCCTFLVLGTMYETEKLYGHSRTVSIYTVYICFFNSQKNIKEITILQCSKGHCLLNTKRGMKEKSNIWMVKVFRLLTNHLIQK